eukprot:CAMPEP_0174722228 /NCGR_PEP_ID=MMETSP1094-20130205/37924_1 /TAXON_ID=156173 /ORGANISM="Chrysochromulina brevifilum, Strain UTEX LB 985" /LENGTH=83 /DNA_ID=CAMNT_0015923043 /DNA_START=176 /DNA_END=428 /DNA_ORIENTATION=-
MPFAPPAPSSAGGDVGSEQAGSTRMLLSAVLPVLRPHGRVMKRFQPALAAPSRHPPRQRCLVHPRAPQQPLALPSARSPSERS